MLSVAGFAVPHHVSPAASPLATSGPTGYSPAQIRHAYGFDKISFSNGTVSGDGRGTTIAIVDAYDDPNIASDLLAFDMAFGLPHAAFSKVNQAGQTTNLPTPDAGWATEIALDVEWAHAIAPAANLILVEAQSASFGDLLTAVDTARKTPGVVAVSMSWGGSEWSSERNSDSYFTTPAGHGGVTFLASSGDSGAPASYPAVSPTVISVGGTSLYLDSSSKITSESGWSGSGGGVSRYESQPGYQKGVVTQSSLYRANPDVAYDANPSTGFSVYDSYNNGTAAPWGQWGGTSDAAPQWAGLFAIADQGRLAAGLSPLDGATQTLPLLYSMSSGDFHDITSGTSTGSPRYSAGPGYDLVTGRGSPVADLIVNDLIGKPPAPAATSFGITATPSNTQAGGTFSVTVTALDASNKPFPGYVGTVHFTSSDLGFGATLPTDYHFLPGNSGTQTFTGVTLVTAGSQTIRATDTANSLLVGSVAITIAPAAADHLAFGQQPTDAVAGAPISPALTVRVLDKYNNLVTPDNSDSVILSLSGGSGTLSGTSTKRVTGGVATFGDLSIGQPGTGYMLGASSGSLTGTTSSNFNVTAITPSSVIESFDASSSQLYTVVGARYASASLSSAARHDGSYGLLDQAGNDWIYRNDAAVQIGPGDTVSVWMKFAGTPSGRAYFGFGATPFGTLSLVAAPNTNQLLIQDNTGFGYVSLGSVSQLWQGNHWYRLEVSCNTNGILVGRAYDSDGTTRLGTVSASASASVAGGIAFRTTGVTTDWDTVLLTHGATSLTTPQATPLSNAIRSSGNGPTAQLAAAIDLFGRYTPNTLAVSAYSPSARNTDWSGLGVTGFAGKAMSRGPNAVLFADATFLAEIELLSRVALFGSDRQ